MAASNNIIVMSRCMCVDDPTTFVPLLCAICRVHAVSIYDSGDIIYSTLEALIHDLGLAGEAGSRPLRSWARELLDIMEEHSGDGYGQSTAEELCE